MVCRWLLIQKKFTGKIPSQFASLTIGLPWRSLRILASTLPVGPVWARKYWSKGALELRDLFYSHLRQNGEFRL